MSFDPSALIVVEPGAHHSIVVRDPARESLARIKAQLETLTSSIQLPEVFEPLRVDLRVLHEHIVMLLDLLFERLNAHRAVRDRITNQLERVRERFDELPDLPMADNPNLDRVRQHLYDERARLLGELRQADIEYWRDVQRVKIQAAEVYTAFASVLRKVQSLTNTSLFPPPLDSLFGFLAMEEPEEFILIHEPQTLTAQEAESLTRLP